MAEILKYKFINFIDYDNKDESLVKDIYFYIDNKIPQSKDEVLKFLYPYCSLLEVLYNVFLKNETEKIENSYIVFIGVNNALKEVLHEGYKKVHLQNYEMTENEIKTKYTETNGLKMLFAMTKSLNFDSFVYLSVTSVISSIRDYELQNKTISPININLKLILNIPIDKTLCKDNLTFEVERFVKELNIKGKKLEDIKNPEYKEYSEFIIFKWINLGFFKYITKIDIRVWTFIVSTVFVLYSFYAAGFLGLSGSGLIYHILNGPFVDMYNKFMNSQFIKDVSNTGNLFFDKLYSIAGYTTVIDKGVS